MTPKGIIVHCSDSPQGRGDDVNTIRQWHLARGWKDVGYHYVILEDGTIQKGRDDHQLGSHARGYNDRLGICLIGQKTFTEDQMGALSDLIIGLCKQYNFGAKDVLGHYEVNKGKTCPNFKVDSLRDTINDRL